MLSKNRDLKTKILIIDDHDLFRDRLKKFISETFKMIVFAEASNGDEALDMISKNDFDLIVLDIGLPDRNGLEILREIKGKSPDLPVLIVSMFPAKEYTTSVLKAGASGYVQKENILDELTNAIQQILRGEKYFSPSGC